MSFKARDFCDHFFMALRERYEIFEKENAPPNFHHGRCDRRMTVGRGYSLHCFHLGRGRVPAYEQKFEDLSVRRETK
jgi:hypothetical protein